MQIVLHAGMPKTGSSSIQKMLAENRDALRSQGVIYPYLGLEGSGRRELFNSHWLLAASLLPDPSEFHILARMKAERRAELLAIDPLAILEGVLAKAGRDDVVLLSTENFGAERTAPGLEHRLLPLLKRYSSDVHCIAYARSPASLYPSSIQQKIRSGDAINIDPSHWTFAHFVRFETLKRLFEEKLVVRVFDRRFLNGNDVADDFLLRLGHLSGMSLSAEHFADLNVSPSASACSIMFHFLRRRAPFNRDLHRTLRVRLEAFEQMTPRKQKFCVPDSWAVALNGMNADGWNSLVASSQHPDSEKESFLLPAGQPEAEIGDPEIVRHFAEILDPTYVGEFSEFLREDDKANLANAVMRSIERVRSRLH